MKVKEGFLLYEFMESIEAIFCFLFVAFITLLLSPLLIWDIIKQRSKEKHENRRYTK